MKFSTRSRYGVRFLVYLGANTNGPVTLNEVSRNEKISIKYLEQIARILKPAGLLSVTRGSKGGYSLAKNPSKISLVELFEVLEGRIEPVACLCEDVECESREGCSTYDFWSGLDETIKSYLASKTLSQLVNEYKVKKNVSFIKKKYSKRSK
jgi:Rrf2 family protein